MLKWTGIFVSWLASATAVLLLIWAAYILYQTNGVEIGPAAMLIAGAALVWVIGQGISYLCNETDVEAVESRDRS